MSVPINDNLDIRAPKLTDRRNGPFASVGDALTAININVRKDGLPVIIGFGDAQEEHWFKSGQLVKKTNGGSGATGGFEYIEINENGELHLTGTARIQKVYLNIDMTTIDGMSRLPGDSGLLILEQDDTGNRQYQLKNNSNQNLGSVYERNFLPRAVTVLEWYRDDRFCYWRKRDIVAGIFPTIKPVFRIDDYYDTLEMLHALPDSQLEISVDNGPWVPYTGLINIGASTLPYGYYRGRVKPDPNRTDSPIEYSLPFFAERKGFPYIFDFELE